MLMFDRTKLKTPIGVLTAVAGEAFDGCPAILIWMRCLDGKDVLLAEIRYNQSDNSVEMGDFNNKLVPEFVKIYEVCDDF